MMIRAWQASDATALTPMIGSMLETTAAQGGQLLATPKNVAWLLSLGLHFAAHGDPTLVYVDDEGIVGFTLWGDLGNPMELDTRSHACTGFGTFVVPGKRRQHVASALRQAALGIARQRGYDCVRGTAYHDEGRLSALAVGFQPSGTEVEYTL
jgi:GNAT superfamily N-acetyltransferase